jgi:hypothetical protein
MALTALIIPDNEGNPTHLQVETIAGDNGCIVHWFKCDENFQHTGEKDASADKRTEEEFHVELRKAAAAKEQLITSHSTNPEWNPDGYVKVNASLN